jgi:hypothetical protein
MRYVAGEQVTYYEVTGLSDPSPAKNLEVGAVLIDRERGKHTQWEFRNIETMEETGYIVGKRLGHARVNDELKPIPSAKLQAKLDAMKEKADA